MADKMLIDASHEEETRVVVVRGNRIEEFDFESQHKKQIRGNIYLAKVTRVEPSLQAAFVDYGGNRHGFLAFAEIHPDYYQIPLADRQALMQAEEEEQKKIAEDEASDPADAAQPQADDAALDTSQSEAGSEAAEASPGEEVAAEKPKAKPRRSRSRKKTAEAEASEVAERSEVTDEDKDTPTEMAAMVETDSISEDVRGRRHSDDDDSDDGEKEEIESVGAEDAMEEVPDRVVRKPRKQYRIQEVIKRRQILLVQVAKEERGNKGAALTTYLSLAGRYSVLMPNTARGGGISRKITQPQDRKRLKEIARELEVPQGMGVIVRTAGANRTRVEIKRDFEYLMRLWENVRTLTLNSTAPCLVYEEGSLIKRSIRDLYNKDISEIVVAGEEGYREAKDFMKMLMPSHAKVVQPYRDLHPIFSRSGIEAQLDRMLQPQVTLKSGGYLIMNQTEALVAIDVNSGRSTREHSIEETALQTNLEAAEEVARQLRLRDLAGLIVIDFIDMEEKRNNRAVEKKLKDCLKNDRARIQVGRISHFGLLEMSRQRIRASVLESTTQICTHCGGTGHVRSQSSVALHVLRGVEEHLLKNTTHDITVRTTPETALYLLNQKRNTVVDYEKRFGVSIYIESDEGIGSSHFAIDRGEPVENPVRIESLMQFAAFPVDEDEDDIVIEEDEEDEEAGNANAAPATASSAQGEEQNGRKRKRRRRRRGGKGGDRQEGVAASEADDVDSDAEEGSDADDSDAAATEASEEAEGDENGRRKRRRRGKRGGRRNRPEDGMETSASDETDASGDESGAEDEAVPEVAATETPTGETAAAETAAATKVMEGVPAPAKPRRSRKKAVTAEVTPAEAELEIVAEAAEPVAEANIAPQVDAALGEEAPQADAPSEEEQKPARANRASNISSSDPVVKSSEPAVDESDGEPPKPKKAGWWQRRGFF
nr:ribonuclease [Rhizobium sp. TCK]